MSLNLTRRHTFALAGGLAAALAAPAPTFAADRDTLRFFAIGDWGKDQQGQKSVAAAMSSLSDSTPPRFIISLGDNFYRKGVNGVDDPRWKTTFEDMYAAPGLQCPWYPVLGNHDRGGEAMAQIAYSQRSARWNFPAPFYWRRETLSDKTAVDFFFLDTTIIVDEKSGFHQLLPGDDADDQLAWLDHALSASNAKWKIVVGHHPVYSGGPHGSTSQLLAGVRPLLERHKVSLYLSGHDHNMQYIQLADTAYAICGVGADTAPVERQVPGTEYVAEQLGFLSLEITPEKIAVGFIDTSIRPIHTAEILAAPVNASTHA